MRENEIEDNMSMSPPSVGSMQIAGSNGFGHSMDFMSQSYLLNRYSEIDIQVQDSSFNQEPPLPVYLKFEDVEFKVRNSQTVSKNPVKTMMSKVSTQNNVEERNKYKKILKGITGSIGPGEILALMGPSGSGKTTLLSVIGGRLNNDNVKGKITYNDVPYSPALKRRIGFVPQEDVLFPQLTVEETLIFSAFLRLPTNMTKQQKYARLENTIKDLGLERCRHTKIAGGISGGERKRTSIGYEILVDPSLLLLDEPTSGLDSTSANKLLLTLQGLAKAGRTIITTIHQPSSRIFHMFSKLLLISEGSPVFYGKAKDTMEYFSSLRFVPEIPMNPAEFLLDLATGQLNDISIPQDIFKDHESTDPSAAVINIDSFSMKVGFSLIATGGSRLVQALGIALLLGLLWWKSSINTEAELRDQVGLMFYICIFWTSTCIFGAVYVFPFEKVYLRKERKADMYRLSVYYASSTLCDMMAHVMYPTIFMLIVYFMAGFKSTAACFFLTLFTILLIAITSQGAGELFGAAVMSIQRAGMVASLILMLFLLTGGYYVQHIPKFMQWMKYMSFMYYGFRLLLKVQYSGDQLYECESEGGCRPLQTSPSFDTVNLKGGLSEVWVLLAMALCFRTVLPIYIKKEAPVNFLTDPQEARSTLRPADVLVFGWVDGRQSCFKQNGQT
ncbi:ABC transporter G family member 26-like protein [Trifolium pratense]|uniref:ABC transporter G family member 26-like protein n=1 Tax=Trifolium pratense TaxID=57577 RepID=A0A2K3MQF5_TRIPR|nr:ABC transporter G family member 26-like protein [Trifolium pratense]